MPNSSLVSVDPGRDIGLATWTLDGRLLGTSSIKTKLKWPEYLLDLQDSFVGFLAGVNASVVLIEEPSFHQSVGGQVVARSGSLMKLALLAGALYAVPCPVRRVWVPVASWKGQLPKEVVKRRLSRRLSGSGFQPANSHEWDAVGVGFHWFDEMGKGEGRDV